MIVSQRWRYSLLILYFVTMCILFCIPGSALPQGGWMEIAGWDKWVHIGLFSVLTFLVCWAAQISIKRGLLITFIVAIAYGIVVEVVQHQFIPNRSFDLGDWGADIIGSFLGIWIWNIRYIKK